MTLSLTWLLLLNLASTLYMVGVILTVQLVHYPLMGQVGAEQFRAYHSAHTSQMSWVVLLPMIAELGTSGLLAFAPLPGVPRWLLWTGFALAVLTWAATFFLSVPLHGKLSLGFDAEAHRFLVQTNWVRTVFWTAHGGITLEILRRLLAAVA
ncbi:MAG: hypothetical protein H7Z41_17680 [Cytophagales bacterium]|nr:hypothetical protein [Armatimonadota bacterium]